MIGSWVVRWGVVRVPARLTIDDEKLGAKKFLVGVLS